MSIVKFALWVSILLRLSCVDSVLAATSTLPGIPFHQTTNNVSALPLQSPAGTSVGDVLLAQLVGAYTTTLSAPAGWTEITAVRVTNQNGLQQRVYYRTAAAAGAVSYAFRAVHSNNVFSAGVIFAIKGALAANPICGTGIQSGGGNQATAPNVQTQPPTCPVGSQRFALFALNDASATLSLALQDGATAGPSDHVGTGSSGGGLYSSYYTMLSATNGGQQTGRISFNVDWVGASIIINPGAAPPLDHIQLEFTGTPLTCTASTVTVKACSNATCSSLYSDPTTVALTANNGGVWSPASVTFSGSTTTPFRDTTVGTTTLGATSTPSAANATTCYLNGTLVSNCQIAVADSALLLTIPTQTAGVTGSGTSLMTVSAVRASNNGLECVPAFAGVSRSVDFWSSYVNPSTGSKTLSVNGTSVAVSATTLAASTASTGTAVTLSFDATGTATAALKYDDVGQLLLNARYDGSATIGDTSLVLLGGRSFVTKPWGFSLVATCADATANAASQTSPSASDPRFCRAGQNFATTVTAINASGSATPNYGRELVPETVKLAWSRQLPSAGSDGVLPTSALPYSASGVFGPQNKSWDEVGILKVATSVGDADYLGTGDVSSAAYVGRFYPDHFDVVVTPRPSCTGFIYAGQPATPAVLGQSFSVSATAKNGSVVPSTTTNYSNASGFSRDVNLTLAAGGAGVGKLYVDATQGGVGAIPAGKFAAGVGTVNHNDPSGKISYVFDVFPTVATTIAIHADDADSSSGSALVAGVNGTTSARSGRLWLGNAYGSERASLSLPYETQYWNGFSFVRNTLDNCTALAVANVGLGDYQGAVSSGNLPVSAIAMGVFSAGSGNINLAAPNAAGSVDLAIRLNPTLGMCPSSWVPAYPGGTPITADFLRGRWCGASPNRDPVARATFGISKASRQIYLRENY